MALTICCNGLNLLSVVVVRKCCCSNCDGRRRRLGRSRELN